MSRDRGRGSAITVLLLLVLALISFPAGPADVSAAASASSSPPGWLQTGPLPVTITDQSQPVLLHDGRVFVVAPFPADSTKIQGEIYDPTTNSWNLTRTANVTDGIDAPVVLRDGNVLLCGGSYNTGKSPDDERYVTDCQIYDPIGNQWHSMAPLLQVHVGQIGVLLDDGTVLVIGGASGAGGTAAPERYNPLRNTWTRVGPLSIPSSAQEVVRLRDGRVLVIGEITNSGELTATASIYNPVTNQWSPAAAPTSLHGQGSATLLPDGRVLLAGGITSSSPIAVSARSEIYDPSTNRWSAGQTMFFPRYNQAAVLLRDGRVLVIGGEGTQSLTPGAEIYDPSSNVWQLANGPALTRHGLAAVVLDDGSVLGVGENPYAARYFPALPSPTERQLPPGGPLPANRVYFAQTGHYLANGFLAYWQHFGGLAVFGYPISEEFQQHGVTVQYFERARFEWHPGSNPARYDVELGLLGDQSARAQGLLTTEPFQPVAATSDANCTFDVVTDHRLCFGFRAYWQIHGGLAIFGRPISEEFKDPASGLTVQYFERAVFENHPNNPAKYQVLLRRLGTDALTGK